MQMTQQALAIGQSLDGKERNGGRERHASEAGTTSSSSDGGSLKENRPDNNNGLHNGSDKSPIDRLFIRGHCHWPGCDVACGDLTSFRRHLASVHSLDDKSTAQTRVQLQIVSQLELQLNKERDRLEAMMRHLKLESRNGELEEASNSSRGRRSPQRSPSPKRFRSEPASSNASPPSSTAQQLLNKLGQHLPQQPSAHVPNISTAASLLASATSGSGLQSPLSALTAAVRSPLLGAMSAPTATSPSSSSASIRAKPTASLVDRSSSSPGVTQASGNLTLPPGE